MPLQICHDCASLASKALSYSAVPLYVSSKQTLTIPILYGEYVFISLYEQNTNPAQHSCYLLVTHSSLTFTTKSSITSMSFGKSALQLHGNTILLLISKLRIYSFARLSGNSLLSPIIEYLQQSTTSPADSELVLNSVPKSQRISL